MGKKKKKTTKTSGGGKGPAILILLVLGVLGVVGYKQLTPSQVKVPSLLGKSQSEAEATLKKLNLRAEIQTEASNSPEAAVGEVLRQAPNAGVTLPPGSVVTIFVADQPASLDVPDVVGKTRSEAEDVLTRAGFTVSFKTARSDKVQVGRVISQAPAAGKAALAQGGNVELTVSGGKGEQVVPDLFDLTPNFARERLKEKGLELVVQQVAQAGFRQGDAVRILRQEPEAGSKVPAGSRVTVFIPIPAPRDIPPNNPSSTASHAPRFEGLTVAQARELASTKGVVIEFAESADADSVISIQEPPPGDPLKSDGVVLVRTAISSVVPGLIGLNEAEARAKIEAAGLIVGSVKRSHGERAGEVLGQSPSAGIETVAGNTVDIVVADPATQPDSAQNPAPIPTPAFTPAPWVE